jgi:hypothetical protein
MQAVSITAHLFGHVSFRRDGEPVTLPHTCVSLFPRLLLSHGRPVNRHRLADLVGQDCPDEAARKRLDTDHAQSPVILPLIPSVRAWAEGSRQFVLELLAGRTRSPRN